MQSPVRFSSCRGVAFEIKPHEDHFFIKVPNEVNKAEQQGSKRLSWLRRVSRNSSKIFPSIQRSLSRPSSHFCDLDQEDDDDDDDEEEDYYQDGEKPFSLARVEEGFDEEKEKPILIPSKSKSEQPKPPRKPQGSRLSVILLDQGLFTMYKRLFMVCFTLNITGLILAATGNFQYARNRAALFAIANIFVLVLCRSEAILRVVFWLTVKIFGRSWVPLFVKTTITSVLQSLGGIHSGCGISSVAWLTYALVLTLKKRADTSPEIIAVASIILGLLALSCLAAFPLVRHVHHNVFERTHRFTGWTALGLLWVFVILTLSYNPVTKSYGNEIGSTIVKHQEFWFTIGITVLIFLPWMSVRRVPVRVSTPSAHAAIIKFDGGVPAGILGRISPSPFSEWHAFGIISDNKKEHMILAGAVGDFTKSLVSDPPTHLWVRQVHFAGLPYLVNMYDRVLLVATGSGICPFLSFLLQPGRANVCFLWVAKGIEANFGTEIKEWMSGHPQDKVIVHDTAVLGRPNVPEMSINVAKKWGAEVVIVTSNPEGTKAIVDGCKGVGIAAFGPIWDS